MKRLKTFGKYALWVILFYIFSNVLIFFAINTNYSALKLKNNLPKQIDITFAEATLVNGHVKATTKNIEEFKDKYFMFSFFNSNNKLAGIKYVKIADVQDNKLEFYFKLNYINSYSVEIVDQADPETEFSYLDFFSSTEYKKYQILYWFTVLLFL